MAFASLIADCADVFQHFHLFAFVGVVLILAIGIRCISPRLAGTFVIFAISPLGAWLGSFFTVGFIGKIIGAIIGWRLPAYDIIAGPLYILGILPLMYVLSFIVMPIVSVLKRKKISTRKILAASMVLAFFTTIGLAFPLRHLIAAPMHYMYWPLLAILFIGITLELVLLWLFEKIRLPIIDPGDRIVQGNSNF